MTNGIAGQEIKQFIDRVARLEQEKADIAEQEAIVDLYKSALGMS